MNFISVIFPHETTQETEFEIEWLINHKTIITLTCFETFQLLKTIDTITSILEKRQIITDVYKRQVIRINHVTIIFIWHQKHDI